jgi:predicted PolB exonuclease-like 3'-5' exonuclease
MISIDIESIPNLDLIGSLPEPEVALGNTKDPEKIKAKIEEAKKEQIDKMGLNPFFARVCSFATWGDIEENCGFKVIDQDISDASEINLITHALHFFCAGPTTSPVIITWNGHNFDIPFLFKRAMLLQMDLPSGLCGMSYFCRKYQHASHIDLMQELCGWNGHLKLDTASKMILGESKADHADFSKFIDIIKSGDGDSEIGVYNLKDAELTWNIYKRVSPYIF